MEEYHIMSDMSTKMLDYSSNFIDPVGTCLPRASLRESLMAARKRRSAPTYLVQRRGKCQGRFRHVDSLGNEHWPCEISRCPLDYQRPLAWVAA